jgi:hypothetical protein
VKDDGANCEDIDAILGAFNDLQSFEGPQHVDNNMKCIKKIVVNSIAIGIVIEYDVKKCVLFYCKYTSI